MLDVMKICQRYWLKNKHQFPKYFYVSVLDRKFMFGKDLNTLYAYREKFGDRKINIDILQ